MDFIALFHDLRGVFTDHYGEFHGYNPTADWIEKCREKDFVVTVYFPS
jgi:hypothetical protein